MVLTDKEIRAYSQDKEMPLITPFTEDQLQSASYDVTLSGSYAIFNKSVQTIDLSLFFNDPMEYYRPKISSDGQEYILQPGEYILVGLREKFNIPKDIVAHIRPRTRFTKIGLLIAGQHCNPTYSGTLHIGLFNASPNALKLSPGIAIAQVVFEQLSGLPTVEKLYVNKKNAAYMNEAKFRGSILNERGWSKDLEKSYQQFLATLDEKE